MVTFKQIFFNTQHHQNFENRAGALVKKYFDKQLIVSVIFQAKMREHLLVQAS